MANKYILVPEEIYKGLTTPSLISTDPNLSFSKNSLENVQQLKIDPEKKNIVYNQELQRFRHLKKDHEEKPVRVLLANEQLVDEQRAELPEQTFTEALQNRVKRSDSRARRSRAPSPEELPDKKPKKHTYFNLHFGFKPRLWN
jgi:heat shock protein HspQ